MRITEIKITNYRQFRRTHILFPKKEKYDIHIFIGQNGTGKTNLLNAINWCLYENEPHLTSNSKALSLLNTNAIKELSNDNEVPVSVQVRFEIDSNKYYTFIREYIYRVHDGSPFLQNTNFRVIYPDEDNNIKIIDSEEAVLYVERLLPQRIREYFFFDGERLDEYFKQEVGDKIKSSVREIAQIELLAKVELRLKEIISDYRDAAGNINPRILRAKELFDDAERSLQELLDKLMNVKKQLDHAEREYAEYTEKLRGFPDIEKIERERDNIIKAIKDSNVMIKTSEGERSSILYYYGLIFGVSSAIYKVLLLIEEKRKVGEIPPIINLKTIDDSINAKKCVFCNRTLNTESEEYLLKLRESIAEVSNIIFELQGIEPHLRIFIEKIPEFEKSINEVNNKINQLNALQIREQERKDEIDNLLSKYDKENVKEWSNSRQNFEELAKKLREQKGEIQGAIPKLEKEVEEHRKELESAMRQENRIKEITQRVEFGSKAIKALSGAKEKLLCDVREKIRERTNEIFLDLIWKKMTYKGIGIDEDYNISLYHISGDNALGSASAAERELLALSFTLALHEVSGFNCPLVIDTPVARVSDINRKNFGESLLKVSIIQKQVILLFTPDEYSTNISSILDSRAASRWRIELLSNEQENEIKRLSNNV